MCKWWNKCDSDDNRGDQGKGFGISKWLKKFSFGSNHGENGQETDNGCCNGGNDRRGHFSGCIIDHL